MAFHGAMNFYHRRKYSLRIVGGLALAAFFLLIGSDLLKQFFGSDGYAANIYAEFLGILATILVLDTRAEQRAEKQLQEQLIRDAGSTSNEIAKNAVHQLRKQGWLEGENGLLKSQNLWSANLSGAILLRANLDAAMLGEADLSSATLIGAKLEKAKLFKVNLSEAHLGSANLSNSHLGSANLSQAKLWKTDLSGATLSEANLSKAELYHTNLSGAKLTGANLHGALLAVHDSQSTTLNFPKCSPETILPDGTHWTPDTDWTKFGAIVEPPEG